MEQDGEGGSASFDDFASQFYPAVRARGMIIDVRRNAGGNIDTWILERLLRAAWLFNAERSGAFYLTLVPIRPRSRGERRSLRTFAVVSLRPPHAFNLRPRRLSTPTDAFQLHPHVRSYGMALRHRARAHFPAREGHRVVREDVRTDRAGRGRPGGGVRQLFKGAREDEPAGVHLPLLQRLLRALRGGANDRTQGAFYYHTGPRTTASAW